MTTTSRSRKWCLVTGVSPGTLGETLATSLLKRGINVVATNSIHTKHTITSRHPEPGSDDGFLVCLTMDVTAPESVARAVGQVARLVDGRLEFLVFCDGVGGDVGYCGEGEEVLDLDVEVAGKGRYDVCVWGLVRVVQGFFPLVREAEGRIGAFGDGEGRKRAGMGVLESSRAAVGSLMRCMEVELEGSGVGVVCVDGSEVRAGEKGRDRFDVAERMVKGLLDQRPVPQRREWWQDALVALLAWILPTWVLDALSTRAVSPDRSERT